MKTLDLAIFFSRNFHRYVNSLFIHRFDIKRFSKWDKITKILLEFQLELGTCYKTRVRKFETVTSKENFELFTCSLHNHCTLCINKTNYKMLKKNK